MPREEVVKKRRRGWVGWLLLVLVAFVAGWLGRDVGIPDKVRDWWSPTAEPPRPTPSEPDQPPPVPADVGPGTPIAPEPAPAPVAEAPAAPPADPLQELEPLGRAVCGRAFKRLSSGPAGPRLGCGKCPGYTSDGQDGLPGAGSDLEFALEAAFRGSFTASGRNEALTIWYGCEPHAFDWGGAVLLRHDGQSWKFVRYDQGFRPEGCKVRPKGSGQDELVCSGTFTQHGESTRWSEVWPANGRKR